MAREINLLQEATNVEDEAVPAPAPAKKSPPTHAQPELPGFNTAVDSSQHQAQQERFIRQHVKRIVEALLFASSGPLTFTKIHEITDSFHTLKPRQLRDLIGELQQEYLSQHRSFRLEEIADGYVLRTCEEYGVFIEKLYINKREEKLSQAAMEVLAIIAYKHPITRQQIEAIRGVDSSGVVQALLDRNLIEVTGRLEVPGRPNLFGVTKEFLEHFGLKNAQELQGQGTRT